MSAATVCIAKQLPVLSKLTCRFLLQQMQVIIEEVNIRSSNEVTTMTIIFISSDNGKASSCAVGSGRWVTTTPSLYT